jgi:hypothetical protein
MSGKLELEQRPAWLEPGQRVWLQHANNRGYAVTVRTVEWPWLVSFWEVPGCAHPRNVREIEHG